jgi:hypothetical protein
MELYTLSTQAEGAGSGGGWAMVAGGRSEFVSFKADNVDLRPTSLIVECCVCNNKIGAIRYHQPSSLMRKYNAYADSVCLKLHGMKQPARPMLKMEVGV